MLPYLREVQSTSKKYSVLFKGLNYGEGTQDGEFADTHNLSTDQYPCITQRAARIKESEYTKPTTLHSKGELLVIDEQPDAKDDNGEPIDVANVYYGGEKVGEVKKGKKQTATVGNYVVIFPDKKYYKVPTDEEEGEFGDMEITYKASDLTFTASSIKLKTFPFSDGDTVSISGCTTTENNKRNIGIKTASAGELIFRDDTFVEAIEEGEITISKSNGDSYKFRGLTFTSSSISKEIVDFPFEKGDSVTIEGCSKNENNKESEVIIRGATEDELTFDSNAFTEVEESEEVTIKRTVPDLDFICENNYRLWGTHKNTIYSSKFSDPINFKSFDGLSEDSYFIDVGSEGEFTGCVPYSSHICFFKENTLHKLYGTKPSNFQVTTANVYGVQSGCEKSMQIVNEQLLYKGVGGVYAYTGGVPELISEKFGTRRYSDAVACCDGEKYYISMKKDNIWSLFTYDVAKNIWLREDDTHAVDMAFHGGKVYFLTEDGCLFYVDKAEERKDIEWGATFCTIHETVNERKVYSKFHLRMDLSADAWLAVDIKTDNDTQWKQIYATHNEKAKTVSIPIMPTRCDCIDIRLRGKGECKVKTFIREFSVGSDV